MSIVVVYNAKSGSGLTEATLAKMMRAAGVTVDEWVAIDEEFEDRLLPHVEAGKTIAVVGGDGTQRAVAALVANTRAVMAPLPGGTLNHFTKDLGVSQDIRQAITRLSTLKVSLVDVASVNDMIFVNNSSVGLYPHSLLEREKTERFLGKWLAAARGTFRALVRFRRYAVTINGQPMRSPFIFVGNNTYKFQKSLLAERSSLEGSNLTLFVLRSWSRFGMIRAALFERFGSRKRTDEFIIEYPRDVVIEAERLRLAVSLDGEVVQLETPLEYKIYPKSLKVLV